MTTMMTTTMMTTTTIAQTEVDCPLCGAKARAAGAYCSSSCYLAGRIPMGEVGLPVSWQLGVALAAFFVFFNQLLYQV